MGLFKSQSSLMQKELESKIKIKLIMLSLEDLKY